MKLTPKIACHVIHNAARNSNFITRYHRPPTKKENAIAVEKENVAVADSKETILIDIDDTIENLLEAWLKALNSKFGTNVKLEDVNDWNITKFFPLLTKSEVFEPLYSNDFWKTVEPKQDAMIYVKLLFDKGYNIYLCTSSDYRTITVKYEYIIQRYFPYIKWENVIITYKKQMIKADYLIDDGIHNLVGGSYKKILMTAPHNKSYDAVANGMIRVYNWREIYDFILR